MSISSFPRPEHVSLLHEKINEYLRHRGLTVEVAERGLNQLKCQYKFGFRRGAEGDWKELAIHFQVAVRLDKSGDAAPLIRMVDDFLQRHFGGLRMWA
jgi:hypothetical protein